LIPDPGGSGSWFIFLPVPLQGLAGRKDDSFLSCFCAAGVENSRVVDVRRRRMGETFGDHRKTFTSDG